MPKSYDRFKQHPRWYDAKPSKLDSVAYVMVTRDKYGVVDVGSFRGDVLATHCAMLSCSHRWHGIKCTECPPSIANHLPREWPGHIT